MNSMQNMFHGLREYLNPLLKDSKFYETGYLTPEEFVAAGDFLVYKCPTWAWEAGEETKSRDYLPKDKQFLITRNVPCVKRAGSLAYAEEQFEDSGELGGEEGWVGAFQGGEKEISKIIQEIEDDDESETITEKDDDLNLPSSFQQSSEQLAEENDHPPSDIEEIPDIEDESDEEYDPATSKVKASIQQTIEKEKDSGNLIKTRTYDLTITYDKYYQTPRIWLNGYDENKAPLDYKKIFEDISQEHAHKTVTFDPHPHLSISLASIHPCKHAAVMKKMIQITQKSGREIRVDQYMILFLKFISCVLPTIDYDHTISMD